MRLKVILPSLLVIWLAMIATVYASDVRPRIARPQAALVKSAIPVAPPSVMPIGVPSPEFGAVRIIPTPTRTIVGPSFISTALPGEVIGVKAGVYRGSQGYVEFVGNGAPDRPITIVGSPGNRFIHKLFLRDSSYVRLVNLDLRKLEIGPGCHHLVAQGCRMGGGFIAGPGGEIIQGTGGGFTISGTATRPVSHIVIQLATVEDNGNWLAEFDEDVHGGVISSNVSHVWVMDSTFTRNSGDGVQINAGSLAAQASTHHIYVARNVAHHNKQTGFHTKQAVNVIFSQNHVYGQWPIGRSPSAWGAGLGYQYGPENVWYIFNHVHDCAYGVSGGSTSGLGFGQSVYVVGNLFQNIRHSPSYPYNPGTAWSNAAISPVGNPSKTIVHNTMIDCDGGVYLPGGVSVDISQNVFENVDHREIWLEDPTQLVAESVRGNRSSPDLVAKKANSVWPIPPGNRAEEYLAIDEMGRPFPGSGLKGHGSRHPVYDLYLSQFGLDIYKDMSGRSRSTSTSIGCWE